MVSPHDTTPSADRAKSYASGYMAAGKEGESVVMAWLSRRVNVRHVEDLRDDPEMQAAEIDCRVHTTDGDSSTVEIKSCDHLGVSGNVLFEMLRINHGCGPEHALVMGWAMRSEADWLFYYAPSVSKIYRIGFDDFRRAAQNYTREARWKSFIHFVSTDDVKSTVNLLIPEKYVKQMKTYRPYEIGCNGERKQ